MTTNDTDDNFLCEKCHFFSKNRKDYERHLGTKKHKGLHNKFECKMCDKTYKFMSGLSRHKKQHHTQQIEIKNQELDVSNQKIDKLEKIIDQLLPKIGNTYNTTNKMTINVFLNEQCKNAISLNSFVNNLKLSLEDLQYTTDHGYVKGISNIFLKYL